jgi:16S rRNA (guanine1516-N2)-methyltransferase
MITTAITADKGIPKAQLDQLSKQTKLPLLSPKISADFLLHITTDYLELRKITQAGKKQKIESIHVDFIGGKTNHRRLHGGGKGQDIAKAVGLHKIKNPSVLDLTAGMGGDAFVLASLGAHITMVERNPVVHALLKDALDRIKLSADADLQAILSRMNLSQQDATTALSSLEQSTLPDIIYLDPMFPSRSKSAQVKKEMQFFHDIVGDDNDSEALLLQSLKLAKKRIVVKRPRLAEKLSNQVQPAFEIVGKSTRYDIYLPL